MSSNLILKDFCLGGEKRLKESEPLSRLKIRGGGKYCKLRSIFKVPEGGGKFPSGG